MLGVLVVVMASIAITLYLQNFQVPTGKFTSTTGKLIEVNVIVDFGSSRKSKSLTVENGTSVFDVLNRSFDIEFNEYEGLGKMVVSIDGVSSNSTHYWLYWVNGELAQVGADSYFLTEDSEVEWRYLSSEEAMKFFE